MNLKRVAAYMAFAALATTVCVQTSLPQKGRAGGADLAAIQRRLDRSELAGLDAELMALAVASPADPKTLELLARLRFKQGRLAESRALYRRVLEFDPRSVSAKINSARIEFVSGQAGEAARLLEGADRGASLTPPLRLELAAAYLLVGDPTTALSVAEALPQNVKNSVGLPLFAEIYLRLGRLDAVGALVPPMKKVALRNAPLAVKCAEILRGAGMIKEAIGILADLPPNVRNNAQVLLTLGRLEMAAENPVRATEYLKHAARLDPRSAEVLSLQAYIASSAGDKDEALKLITRARDAAPSSPRVLADFVALTLRIGKPVLAYEAARALTALVPEDWEYQYLLGVAALQSGNLVPAQETLTRYVELHPDDFRGCLALGMVFAAQSGQTERAQTQLARCTEIDPSNTEARYRLALSFKSQGENKRAIALLEEVLERAPDHAVALRDLGALYLDSGDDAKARSRLERAVALLPNDGDTHFQLTRLYNRIGETALAKQHQEIFQKLRGPGGRSAQ